MESDSGCYFNGLVPNKRVSLSGVFDMERWKKAEGRTAELISRIQPDQISWERRKGIASYMQRLITESISCEVLIYGSVPLKTYLPDGDIDITLFSEDQNFNDNCAAKVHNILENARKNDDSEYKIKEVLLIPAQVKVVKCLVDNIVVDISFSQLGGLCTLSFLEQMDQHINQNHLFKRSIILIKAWCYYESRLLGAYHGLLSTYALETLILYIFHVFNNSFAGPLEVLYRFLEFFSSFDWDNYCISLRGPVPIRSLPDMTADPPRKDGGALFFSKGFLDTCSCYYSVVPSAPEINEAFGSKHINIIDFLRSSNNLGRSVSKGNFYRIRSAFTFGTKRLTGLLGCPRENVVTELDRFFATTWEMNGGILRPDTHLVHSSEKGAELDDPGYFYDASSYAIRYPENRLFCSEYKQMLAEDRKQSPALAQTSACCPSEDRKQYELIIENGDLMGKCGDGEKFLCYSYNNSMLKVSSDKLKDGSPLMSNSLSDERFWRALIMDHTHCQSQSHRDVFQQFFQEVDSGKEDDRLWNAETATLSFQTPDWAPITSKPLHTRSRRTVVHDTSLLPATSCAATQPNLTCTLQDEGKRNIKHVVCPSGSTLGTDKDCTNILSGDLDSHLSNMLYAKSCKISNFEGPYLEAQFLSVPGKPSSPAKSYTILPETAVMPSSHHHSDESSLARGGYKHFPRGTHAPNLKMEKSCRDFESSSTRGKQKGQYRYHRKEQYNERQVNPNFNSNPQSTGRSHQWVNPNTRLNRSGPRNNALHLQWMALGEQPSLSQAKRVSDRI